MSKELIEKQAELIEIYYNWATVKSKSDMQVIARLESEIASLKSAQEPICPYYDEAQGRHKCTKPFKG